MKGALLLGMYSIVAISYAVYPDIHPKVCFLHLSHGNIVRILRGPTLGNCGDSEGFMFDHGMQQVVMHSLMSFQC